MRKLNLCRCTGYRPIIAAIQEAGRMLRNDVMDVLAAEHSIGVIFTKGIRPQPATSPNPFIAKTGRSSLMNADWSDVGFEQWLEEIESLRERDFMLVTSIAKNYVTPQEAADMAEEIAKRGPNAVSLVDYDPDSNSRFVAAISQSRTLCHVKCPARLGNRGYDLRFLP